MKYSKEYEAYVKTIVDEYIQMCSVERDYWDYCNLILERNSGKFYNFRKPDVDTLFDMIRLDEFYDKKLIDKLTKRQHKATKWLQENLLSYYDWLNENE